MKLSVVLKLIDRRALVAAAVLIFVAVGLQVYVAGNANSNAMEVEGQARQIERQNEALQADIARMRLAGVESVQDLLRKVGTAEQNLPGSVDPLLLQTLVAQGAAVAGVDLGSVAPGGTGGSLKVGQLTGDPYTIQFTGPRANVFDFFETMMGADGWIITFGDVSLSPPSGTVTEDSAFASGEMSAAGTMYIWTTAAPRLVGSAALDSAGSTQEDADTAEADAEGEVTGDPLADLAEQAAASPAASQPASTQAPAPPASPAPVQQ